MAEGFAKLYGKDVLIASSSGLAPTDIIVRETIECMGEKGIDLSDQYPKRYDPHIAEKVDLIVNMSGYDLPGPTVAPVQNWIVRDPIGQSEEVFRKSRDNIERQVMQLILHIRKQERGPAQKRPASAR